MSRLFHLVLTACMASFCLAGGAAAASEDPVTDTGEPIDTNSMVSDDPGLERFISCGGVSGGGCSEEPSGGCGIDCSGGADSLTAAAVDA